MKPAPFDYQAPGTLRVAVDLLASNPEALVIAGGQSLMPVLAFRPSTPSLLSICGGCPGSAMLPSATTASGSARSYAGAISRTTSG